MWTVSGTFPSSSIVPLYNGVAGSEAGQAISMLGYGYHEQGSAYTTTIGMTTIQNGWTYQGGHGDPANGGDKNFGTNTVSFLSNDGASGSPTLDFQFLPIGGDQAILAPGDSGGGVFINVGGTEYLAGVNYGVLRVLLGAQCRQRDRSRDLRRHGTLRANRSIHLGSGDQSRHHVRVRLRIGNCPLPVADQRRIVPEPSTVVLLGVGAIGLVIASRRRRRRS